MVYPGTPFVTLFDDACCMITAAGKHVASGPSRGLVLKLEPATHTAIVADQYTQGASFDSEFMGDIEPLPGGNEFVGWGSQPRFSECTASGRMLLDAVLPGPDITYRATVEPWVGLPLYPPSGAARQRGGKTTVYASWNGATQVVSWRVLAGSTSHNLVPATTASKLGFETAIVVSSRYRTFRVQALDARSRVIGASAPFAVQASSELRPTRLARVSSAASPSAAGDHAPPRGRRVAVRLSVASARVLARSSPRRPWRSV